MTELYDNYFFDPDEMRSQNFNDPDFVDYDDEDLYRLWYDEKTFEWEELCFDFGKIGKELNGKILCRFDLGLWDGHRKGLKVFDKLEDILSTGIYEYTKVFVDNGVLTIESSHHDGTNTYEYGLLDPDDELEFTDLSDFDKRTSSLEPFINKYYGYEDEQEVVPSAS